MPVFFDSVYKRLVFIREKALADFWDRHWAKSEVEDAFRYSAVNLFITKNTSKHLRPGATILEGGCGLGQNLFSLHKMGYKAYGIDYASDTVVRVKKYHPELSLICGDVMALPFPDNYFDGYWSLGVIEHFYDGFEPILKEMKRVIKPGGYLFLTFPCMSWYRRKKASEGKYKDWMPTALNIRKFYQFALDAGAVAEEFEANGFVVIKKSSLAGFKGFKDEMTNIGLKRLLQKLYDSRPLPVRALVYIFDIMLAPLFGHSAFMVLERREK